MSVATIVANVVSGAIAPIANIFIRKTERKIAKDTINGNVQIAKLENQAEVNVGIKDWEILSKANEAGTWKDEYVTLSVFSIFNVILIGGVGTGLGYEWGPQLIDGVSIAVNAVNATDGLVGKLLLLTATAALSIKALNAIR